MISICYQVSPFTGLFLYSGKEKEMILFLGTEPSQQTLFILRFNTN